ncbi:MAG: sulfatase-like hydrolase/transferase [Myxococcota bacterium]|nr:sulfatase-like hydrolase/transferase [Myxococcota bacterium]
MPNSQNFLIIITDQHRPDHTGFGGNPILQTPHLDTIAARGMRFDRAIVANPICMPNRASIATGRVPSVHGTRYNGIPLDWAANTFMRKLREQGYHNGWFGKCHLQNMGHNPEVATRFFGAAPQQDASQQPHPIGWDDYEDENRHKRERVEVPSDFYGLDEVDLVVQHADLAGGHYYQWLVEQGVEPEKLQGRANALPHDSLWNQVWRTAVPEDLYPSAYVTQQTVAFLERQRGAARPFLAVCSYPDPHHPFTPPGRYFDLYDPKDIQLPTTFDDPHTDSMRHYRRMKKYQGKQAAQMAPWAPTAEQFRQMAACEYGMISMIDDGVGRILACLEESGHADDTVVLFTSDHGDMFGDHGIILKAAMHYEGCIRVPLVISSPGRNPGVCTSLASSLDLAQTILELAGADEYLGMQGTSLVPLLDDPDARVRDQVLVEEDEMFDMIGGGRPLRMRTLVTDEARISIYRGEGEGELFDLQRDPDELHNLWNRREALSLRAEMTEKLAHALMEHSDQSPRPDAMA